MSVTRRQVLARTGALGFGIAFSGTFTGLFAGTAAARGHDGYGLLVPDPAGQLDPPKGFGHQVPSRPKGITHAQKLEGCLQLRAQR